MNPQKFLELIKFRRSIRKFSDKPIEEDKLKLILESARLAPSSSNSQPWHFVVINDKGVIRKLVDAVPLGIRPNSWFSNAPTVIACLAKPHIIEHKLAKILANDYHRIDVAIAIQHMVLMATSLGIGTCWVGWFDQKKVKKILHVPAGWEIVMLLPVGYPKEENVKEVKPKPRKTLSQIISFNEFNQKGGVW